MADTRDAAAMIPHDFARALIDYVSGCRWCAYDARNNPAHHERCPRYRPVVVGRD